MNVLDLIKKYDGKAVVDSVSFEIPKGKDVYKRQFLMFYNLSWT